MEEGILLGSIQTPSEYSWEGILLQLLLSYIQFLLTMYWVLFENKPALYFCNCILITHYKTYIFWFRIKDTV